jgi:NitT/TauT family transport system ATP-binding protein
MGMATTTRLERRAGTDVKIDSVSLTFELDHGAVTALSDVSLHVQGDEFVCIMGPSGCGKTTILNAIAGFVLPTTGVVTAGGRPVSSPGPDRAVVFQDDAVFPWMTVEDNIAYSLRMRRRPKAEVAAAVDHYTELVGLTEFRTSWPRQLSGGMKKRVDLARAYAAQPDVLLLDEPFGALDPITKERLQEELHALHAADPRTTVFVTHDMEEALYLGDRVVVMTPRPGKIAEVYTPGFPVERDASIKTDPGFVELVRQIRKTLHGSGTE